MINWNINSDKPTSHCRYCGRKLTLTNEFNSCTECKNKELNDLLNKTFIVENDKKEK